MHIKSLPEDEFRARLGEDCLAIERALGSEITDAMRGRMAELLMDASRDGTCAEDAVVGTTALHDPIPVADRVRLISTARTAGYKRPWRATGEI